ncbi:hypothetical protein NEF87_000999 [Candidatus Lokiarchaeum ossiferum]|uniref:Glyoxalase/fosfomycin resistance/dioxygenase domain-containing protein n=1 Tax=Candidatus Lokiarchaeum ossiferum TaxID=2951803 RepID=A0ABY6HQG1_9ARCH|nr:hypothetical protein NEF87_000999 [Candidatus Lokiarchaeum sp. B-35]
MNPISHFEINADDPIRAKLFYESVFQWKITKWEGQIEYWNIQTSEMEGKSIDGGLQKREDPLATIQNFITVPSIDEYVQKVKENGGQITTPKITIPSVGYCIYFKDTEGNTSGMMEWDKNAD